MKFFLYIFFSVSVWSADSIVSWLSEGTVSGNLRYYYIETNKQFISGQKTSAHGNSLGGQISYASGLWDGWKLGATFMTTQPFKLPENVESSAIGQDNGFRGKDHADGFTILGEAYLDHSDQNANLWYGRRVITTPMIGAKDVRMLPSAVEGGEGRLFLNEEVTVSLGYIDKFKQRSSDEFTNITEHALGADTLAVTGHNSGYAVPVSLSYKIPYWTLNLYDLYVEDFLNTAYADFEYNKGPYLISAQILNQQSIGNADHNLALSSSVTKGKQINASAVGVRAKVTYKESNFDFIYRNIARDEQSYDSIITPWDGTVLYAYSSVTNNLGQSFYGNALTAGGAYVGGTKGYRLGYGQTYDFIGYPEISTHLYYALYQNSRYREDQEDLKASIRYSQKDWYIEFKGIWIDNDTYTSKDGTVNQLDWLTQFHVIANYRF